MKKLFTIMLAVFMLFACVSTAGCKKEPEPCKTHTYDETGKCTVCEHVCGHEAYLNEVCAECGVACSHAKELYYNGVCVCGKECSVHEYENDECSICGHVQTLKATTASKLTSEVVDGELVYTLIKTVPGNCNLYSDNAFWIDNYNDSHYVGFEFYSDDFNYFQLCSADGVAYMNFNVYGRVKCINMADNSVVALDPEADGGIWTGEVLPTGTWLKFVVDVRGIDDLSFIFWSSHEGTAKIKNIEFYEIKKQTEDYITHSFDADGSLIYQLIKVNDLDAMNYAANANYISVPENRTKLTFDIKNEQLDYFKLCAGNEFEYSDISFADKVVVKNKTTGETVAIEEANWTGNVLETGVWYTVTVDVTGMADLGIVFDTADFGISYVSNIQFN